MHLSVCSFLNMAERLEFLVSPSSTITLSFSWPSLARAKPHAFFFLEEKVKWSEFLGTLRKMLLLYRFIIDKFLIYQQYPSESHIWWFIPVTSELKKDNEFKSSLGSSETLFQKTNKQNFSQTNQPTPQKEDISELK